MRSIVIYECDRICVADIIKETECANAKGVGHKITPECQLPDRRGATMSARLFPLSVTTLTGEPRRSW